MSEQITDDQIRAAYPGIEPWEISQFRDHADIYAETHPGAEFDPVRWCWTEGKRPRDGGP